MKISSRKICMNGKDFDFNYREDSAGDKGVVNQIFEHNAYNINQWAQGKKLIDYHNQESQKQPSLIIDAGANIGASPLYFSQHYSNSVVFSIEPEVNNWHLLELNTSSITNIYSFNGAISNFDGEIYLEDPGLSDWGFRTKKNIPSSEGGIKVKSICPASILSHPIALNKKPLIIKIDIEGGEDDLFSSDVAWINMFPLIIIELHDWMLPFSGSSRNFIKTVAQFDFDFIHRGENIFIFNREILG